MNYVLLVDDHPLFRQALHAVIKSAEPELTIAEAESLAEARIFLAAQPDVSLITLDMKMPDCSGLDGLLQIRAEFPRVPVVMVSTHAEPETIGRAMAFGAAGYIPKSSAHAEIVAALHAILSGEFWTPRGTYAGSMPALVQSIATLSPAQLRILMGLQRGLRNKEIAYEMGVTEKTVKAYMSTVFRKLGVSSRTQALIVAQELLAEAKL